MPTNSLSSHPSTIHPLATFTPPSSSRAWHSSPHPSLPLLATASSDKSVRIYSLASFRCLSTVAGGHKRSVRASAWKPGTQGESVLATGSFDASCGIWRKWEGGGFGGDGEGDEEEEEEDDDGDGEDYRFAVILDGHESEIKSVAWSAGGQYLATCSRDKSVWIWEELEDDNFETVAVLQEHEGDVKCVVWHPTEELLASASYDDTIRLYKEDVDDWMCVGVLEGHKGTVWCVDFEGTAGLGVEEDKGEWLSEEQKAVLEQRKGAGPRLISSSDDMTIRVWRRIPKERSEPPTGQGRIPSIIRSNSIEEQWVEEARLPERHERSIYSVAWSKKTGLVVSTGSDGKIVVYKERWRDTSTNGISGTNAATETVDGVNGAKAAAEHTTTPAEWVVVAEIDGAHDVFEVNHVCWARRYDKGRREADEEIVISTGDDGEVKAWTLG